MTSVGSPIASGGGDGDSTRPLLVPSSSGSHESSGNATPRSATATDPFSATCSAAQSHTTQQEPQRRKSRMYIAGGFLRRPQQPGAGAGAGVGPDSFRSASSSDDAGGRRGSLMGRLGRLNTTRSGAPSSVQTQSEIQPQHTYGSRFSYLSTGPSKYNSVYSDTVSVTSSGTPLPPNPYMITGVDSLYKDNDPDEDDWLHDVQVVYKGKKKIFKGVDKRGTCWKSCRGIVNLLTLVFIMSSLAMLFLGYPIIIALIHPKTSTKGAFGLGGTNMTGQVPALHLFRTGLIDPDTPKNVYRRKGWKGQDMNLVFSDEFNLAGRSFYPGDDPFWEAVDLDYWETGNYEWYDPAAVTTKDGALVITFAEHVGHNKNFRSGMLQSWNKFCFSGGRMEVSLILPGADNTPGFWPAIWLMGNLGRAGYGASTHGTWPYLYDSCDVGTLSNQSWPPEKGGGPVAAETGGWHHQPLSYLPGQKFSACTCPGEDHPGPKKADGTFKGRGAPELDLFETSVGKTWVGMSRSMQAAPFNNKYEWNADDGNANFPDDLCHKNPFIGNKYQQSFSGLCHFDLDSFEGVGNAFRTFSLEWKGGSGEDAYVTWLEGEKVAWNLNIQALDGDEDTGISRRSMPEEPMYVILNNGMSAAFSDPDFDILQFPSHQKVDWIRIYQNAGEENVGCDPPNFPTKKYIERHIEAYMNANLTTWTEPKGLRGGYGGAFPKNRLIHDCPAAGATFRPDGPH